MKLFYTLLFFLSILTSVNAQRFNGQWKGGFNDNSSGLVGFGGDKIDYVLEIECRGSRVTGYSYTYFMGGAKRYYTICKLTGTLNKTTKEIVVTEIERTKYNTPPDFRNCFQTHKLRYEKDADDVETLEGTWEPAPNQSGGCGFGKTLLTRRVMKTTAPLINSMKPALADNKKNTPFRNLNKNVQPPLALKEKTIAKEQNKKTAISVKPAVKNPVAKNDEEVKNTIPIITPQLKNTDQVITPKKNFEERSKSLVKTIEIQEDTFNVQLYDNGEIDGDSVSVFYNGSLLVSHKRLSDKPISLTLSLNKSAVNELTMFAENLGTIPPNTALMIVTDGSKRYEVRITSDTEKNGTIAFIRKGY